LAQAAFWLKPGLAAGLASSPSGVPFVLFPSLAAMSTVVAHPAGSPTGRSELMLHVRGLRKGPAAAAVALHHSAAVNPVPAGVQRAGARAPRNGHELARELRSRASPADKVAWLAEIPEKAYAVIFRVEVDAELLQTMLAAMLAACSGEGGAAAAAGSRGVLSSMARQCPKALGFAASFGGEPERARASSLLAALEKDAPGAADDVQVIRGLLLGEDS